MAREKIQECDREAVAEFIERHWASRVVMSGGHTFYPHQEQGFIERRDGAIVGLLTYRVDGTELEVLTLNAILEGQGIGSSLMLETIQEARISGCDRIWLTTTNDRLRAIGFYQRLGFRMVAVNLDVVSKARETKPQIPKTGERGVEIRDEIVMEIRIEPYLDGPVSSTE